MSTILTTPYHSTTFYLILGDERLFPLLYHKTSITLPPIIT
ncbi:MAG: hypothetical protein SPJ29_07670 [Phocaeicola sp.]|nr:hypothetical protein [Prevotellaceae bacterium]MDY5939599.1 hypothetical protein [Phocaeicola sp.]